MEKLKKKELHCVHLLRKALNVLKLEVKQEPIDKMWILDTLSKLENSVKEIKMLDDSILDFMSEDDEINELAMNKELEDMESYSDAFITIKRKIKCNI